MTDKNLVGLLRQNDAIKSISSYEDMWDMIYFVESVIRAKAFVGKPVGNRRMVDLTILMKKADKKDIPQIVSTLLAYQKFKDVTINLHVNGSGKVAYLTLPDAVFRGLIS